MNIETTTRDFEQPRTQSLTIEQFLEEKEQKAALGFNKVIGSLNLGASFWLDFTTTPKGIEHIETFKRYLIIEHDALDDTQALYFEASAISYDPFYQEYILENSEWLILKLTFEKESPNE